MPTLSLGRGIADEYEVSEFVWAVHEGDRSTVERYTREGSDWKSDWMAAYVAIRLNHKEIFKYLIEAGIEVPELIYSTVVFNDESFLPLLPHNPDLLSTVIARKATSDLNVGLFNGKLCASDVKAYLEKGADIHTAYFFNHSVSGQLPIQIATRYPDLSVMMELQNAGAELQSTIEGKSISRLVIEHEGLSKTEILNFDRFFKAHRAYYVPELSLLDRFRVWRGLPATVNPS